MDEGGEDDPMVGASSESTESQEVKKCNCKKSRCLKLYCECFSSGITSLSCKPTCILMHIGEDAPRLQLMA